MTDRVADRYTDICWYDIRTAASASPAAPDLIPGRGPDPSVCPVNARRSVLLRAVLMFYGPRAMEHAEKARVRFLEDLGPGCARSVLRDHAIVPAACPDLPNVFSEPDGTQWRNRADLELPLRLLLSDRDSAPALLLPPEIIPLTDEEADPSFSRSSPVRDDICRKPSH